MSFDERMNRFLDWLSDFFAQYPGVLPILGLLLIVLNFILQIFPGPNSGWFVESNFCLHLGLIIAMIGFLLVRPITRE
ncbi:MAG: hypothetical protein H6662_11195 [Ardenticatenaceae bacterium]|nr:hypothetical protein [Anaerolineales bacterium]MCB8922139.1 hypothetical protein [Ardenticatenaceae bacterium]MCB8991119.1 hypothetical protein [Ardenticatenaceae bacterium]MCB9005275.1 hypothetical protein [Ardenticatenaceae bacterium]